jgi:hypothetical protein
LLLVFTGFELADIHMFLGIRILDLT